MFVHVCELNILLLRFQLANSHIGIFYHRSTVCGKVWDAKAAKFNCCIERFDRHIAKFNHWISKFDHCIVKFDLRIQKIPPLASC